MCNSVLKDKCVQLLEGETVAFPSCAKVNLFLYIIGRRADGYHLIKSLFVPVSLFDILKVRLISKSGLIVRCDEDWFDSSNNTLKKAFDYFSKFSGFKIGMSIWLIKNIPVGSGLGGGSSNAATLLKLLNILMKLRDGNALKLDELLYIGAKIGADVPFFIKGRPAMIEGIGDIIKEIRLKDDLYFVIAYPSIPFYTRNMYNLYDKLNRLTKHTKGDKHLPPFLGYKYIARTVYNDFEAVLRGRRSKIIMNLKNSLKKYGAGAAALSGSGSAVFGIFRDVSDSSFAYLRMIEDFPDYKIFSAKVVRGDPL